MTEKSLQRVKSGTELRTLENLVMADMLAVVVLMTIQQWPLCVSFDTFGWPDHISPTIIGLLEEFSLLCNDLFYEKVRQIRT